jgi:hypothetical protein
MFLQFTHLILKFASKVWGACMYYNGKKLQLYGILFLKLN